MLDPRGRARDRLRMRPVISIHLAALVALAAVAAPARATSFACDDDGLLHPLPLVAPRVDAPPAELQVRRAKDGTFDVVAQRASIGAIAAAVGAAAGVDVVVEPEVAWPTATIVLYRAPLAVIATRLDRLDRAASDMPGPLSVSVPDGVLTVRGGRVCRGKRTTRFLNHAPARQAELAAAFALLSPRATFVSVGTQRFAVATADIALVDEVLTQAGPTAHDPPLHCATPAAAPVTVVSSAPGKADISVRVAHGARSGTDARLDVVARDARIDVFARALADALKKDVVVLPEVADHRVTLIARDASFETFADRAATAGVQIETETQGGRMTIVIGPLPPTLRTVAMLPASDAQAAALAFADACAEGRPGERLAVVGRLLVVDATVERTDALKAKLAARPPR
jgi:hypothetical protein